MDDEARLDRDAVLAELVSRLVLSHGLGHAAARQCFEQLVPDTSLAEAIALLRHCAATRPPARAAAVNAALEDARLLEACRRAAEANAREGIAPLIWSRPAYPPRLAEIAAPPAVLFAQGEADPRTLFAALAVTVVGTLQPQLVRADGGPAPPRFGRAGSASSPAWPWASTASPTAQRWRPAGRASPSCPAAWTSSIPPNMSR